MVVVVVVMVEKVEARRTRRQPRIGGPTGGKSRNEGSYLGGSLSPAITPGSGAARKKVVGVGTAMAVYILLPGRQGAACPWNYIKMKS